MSRENIKLAVVMAVCLLLAWSGPSIAHGVHAKFAHNADKVDGRHAVGPFVSKAQARKKLVAHNGKGELAAKFLPRGAVKEGEWNARTRTIITSNGPGDWVRDNGQDPGTFNGGYFNTAQAGAYLLSLRGVQRFGGKPYGLRKLQVCYDGDGAGSGITHTQVFGAGAGGDDTRAMLANDATDRLTAGCYQVPVNQAVPFGADVKVFVNNPGVDLAGVKAWWTRGITTLPRQAPARESGE